MAKVVKGKFHDYILLKVTTEFIEKYNLWDFASCYEYNLIGADADEPEHVKVVFTPLFKFKNVDFDFLNEYYNYFLEFLSTFKLQEFIDEILLFNSVYLFTRISKQIEVSKERYLNERAKLILQLIKIPLPKLRIDDYKTALIDYHYRESETQDALEFEDFQASQHVAAMLNLITGKDDLTFMNENHRFDKSKVDAKTKVVLLSKFDQEYNFAIKLSPEADLLVSRNVQLSFSTTDVRKSKGMISPIDQFQNKDLIKILLQGLVDHQRENNTLFYQELLKTDFTKPIDFKKLGKIIGLYDRQKQHVFSVKALYERMEGFLSDHNLLQSKFPTKTKQMRNKFLYQYLIISGIPLTGGIRDSTYNFGKIMSAVKVYTDIQNHLYANKAFRDSFKNLK